MAASQSNPRSQALRRTGGEGGGVSPHRSPEPGSEAKSEHAWILENLALLQSHLAAKLL